MGSRPSPLEVYDDVIGSSLIGTAQVLASKFQGKTDDELLRSARHLGGVESVVRSTIEGLARAIDPRRAEDCTIAYRVRTDDDEYATALVIRSGRTRVIPVARLNHPVDCTLSLLFGDFIRMLVGELEPMSAVLEGRLVIEGNGIIAARLPQMLQSPLNPGRPT